MILTSAVSGNPHNAISLIVTLAVERADSVAVRFGVESQHLDGLTASVKSADGAATVPVLGLLPTTAYTLQAVAWGQGEQLTGGQTLTFSTGALPGDLPSYRAGGPAPSEGYVVFAAGLYGLVIDNDGRVVWYHRFEEGPGLNFQAQPNGRYVARPPPVHVTVPEPWIEIDVLGNTTRRLYCVGDLQTRFHDMIALPDESYWILCDETRLMDLSALGGMAEAQVTGTVLQHVSPDGTLLFQWSAFDHFEITDLDPADRTGPAVNWTHGNAVDLDADGTILLSFRSLNEVTRIDGRTGMVLWRMGGLRNQFSFEGTGEPPFAHQHGLRLIGANNLMVLDNLGEVAGSRAEKYVYDETTRTARLVMSYESLPGIFARLGGTTQNLPDGHTLVAFGNGRRVEEYDASGQAVWSIDQPGYVFRAQRIRSLYQPGVDTPR